ncbi:MAG TPA: hypothetical protein VE398_15570 [Acidobacteriota bacterium]|nr:hypothetical protein [Acidobacteriota bacterium]
MEVASGIITVIYYCMVAYIAAILVWNLIKAKRWDKEILYIVVLIPFLLRLFRLK